MCMSLACCASSQGSSNKKHLTRIGCNSTTCKKYAAATSAMQVMSALEKLSTRERFLNSQCEHLTAEYREAKEGLSQLQLHFNQKQDAAAELENELARVSQVRNMGKNMSNIYQTQTLSLS